MATREAKAYQARFARNDPDHCLADGLWRPNSARNARAKRDVMGRLNDPRPAFVATRTTGDGTEVRFAGAHQPDDSDLVLMNVLLALAAKHERGLFVAGGEAQTSAGQGLIAALRGQGDPSRRDTVYLTTSRAELMSEAGMAWSSRQGAGVLACLRRMSEVSVRYSKGGSEAGGFALLAYTYNDANGRIDVMLNPATAATALGTHRPYVLIELAEIRRLRKPAARILYQRLCATIDTSRDKGGRRSIGLDKLARYAFSDRKGTEPGTLRVHRHRTREALTEITGKTLWRAVETSRDVFTIQRPSTNEVQEWGRGAADDSRGTSCNDRGTSRNNHGISCNTAAAANEAVAPDPEDHARAA